MKQVLASLILIFTLTSYCEIAPKNLENIPRTNNCASSLLYVYNSHIGVDITAVTYEYTDGTGYHSYTVNVTIPTGSSSLIISGNLSTTITVTLSLSAAVSGSLRDWYYNSADQIFYEMGCQNFNSTTSPSLTFYFYSVNHLYLSHKQNC